MIRWKETSKELVVKSFLFQFFKVGFKSVKSGKEGKFDVLETKDWVNVVPITKDGNVIMVRQFRFGSQETSLEFPAGAIETGENPLDAAKRELLEETGSLGTSVVQTGKCRPNPAFMNNTCYHFAATGVESLHEQKLDPFEEIEFLQLPLAEVDRMVKSGEISHALSIAAWHFYQSNS